MPRQARTAAQGHLVGDELDELAARWAGQERTESHHPGEHKDSHHFQVMDPVEYGHVGSGKRDDGLAQASPPALEGLPTQPEHDHAQGQRFGQI